MKVESIMAHAKVESKLRSDKDREFNLDRLKVRGSARELYMDRKVKLSNIESLMASNKGLALTKSLSGLLKSKTTKPETA